MPILREQDKQAIRERLQGMTNPVKIVVFTQELGDCQYCPQTKELMTELAELSDKLTLEVKNLVIDKEDAELYDIDKVPAIAIVGIEDGKDVDPGIRFFGIPAGYEFAALLEDILMVSNKQSGLPDGVKNYLKTLDTTVRIMVFVTPTCPYCPNAVFTAHQFALESDKVTGMMIEATEFPDLSNRFEVRAVPKIVVNEKAEIEGAVPPEVFVDLIKQSI